MAEIKIMINSLLTVGKRNILEKDVDISLWKYSATLAVIINWNKCNYMVKF